MFRCFNRVRTTATERFNDINDINLCSRKWLNPTLKRVNKITPKSLPKLKVGFAFGLKNLRIAYLKRDIEGRFLIRLSREFHLNIQ